MGKTKRSHRIKRRRSNRRPRALTKREIAARISEALKARWSVECFYRGFDPLIDNRIRKLAGRRDSDSGMALWTGLRDMTFRCATEKAAVTVAKRIKAAKIRGVHVRLRGFWRA